MAGVASPMLRRTRSGGARFLVGLLGGGIAAGLLLSVPAYLIGTVIQSLVPTRQRIIVLAGILAILAIADLLRRTPYLQRQVPQGFIWKLPPGFLGVAWGFDLGLLFTTQKVTSLIWVAIAGVVLLGPSMAAVLLVSIAVVASLAIAVWSVLDQNRLSFVNDHKQMHELVQRGSGVLILILAITTAVHM